jgi:hypothetical protein
MKALRSSTQLDLPSDCPLGEEARGLDTLFMPPVPLKFAVLERPSPQSTISLELEAARRDIGHVFAGKQHDVRRPLTVHDRRIFWYRWVMGHQVSIIIWYLINVQLRAGRENEAQERETVERLELLTDSYSCMLRYSGSCPPATYEHFIRPQMEKHHPRFSGTWAPDYIPVRRFFLGS